MTLVFQLAIFALIVTSSILLVRYLSHLLLLVVSQVIKMLYFLAHHYGLD